jgi:hypothetical protein
VQAGGDTGVSFDEAVEDLVLSRLSRSVSLSTRSGFNVALAIVDFVEPKIGCESAH